MILRRAAALILVVLATTACGSTVAGSPSPQADGATPTAAAGPAAVEGPPVDACSLLKPEEVEALIGANDGGKGSPGARSVCVWETAEDLSVTVDIGAPGTAAGGLPAWEPALGEERRLPDGMREINGGVQFAAGGRDCLTQVVADPGSDKDVQTGIALAKKLQGLL